MPFEAESTVVSEPRLWPSSKRRSTRIGALLALLLVPGFGSVPALLSTPGEAQAQERAASRIAFVDIPYLIDKAPQALAAEKRLEAEFAPRQAALEQDRTRLSELSVQLADDQLDNVSRQDAEREYRLLERRVKRDEQDFREELNIQKNNEFKQVRVLVLEAIARFGKDNDYDLIVSDGVLFANARIDVTERILERLMQEANRRSAN